VISIATYVISDVHGHYDMFLRMLEQIKFSDSDSLLLLGDNIDRSHQNTEMLEFIKQHKNVQSLIGNHEQMMLDDLTIAYDGEVYVNYGDWIWNGGKETFEQILEKERKSPGYIIQVLKQIRNWKYSKALEVSG